MILIIQNTVSLQSVFNFQVIKVILFQNSILKYRFIVVKRANTQADDDALEISLSTEESFRNNSKSDITWVLCDRTDESRYLVFYFAFLKIVFCVKLQFLFYISDILYN